jgi:protein-L-isoaspartate O-methyltransferase
MDTPYDDLIFRSQPRKSSLDLMAAVARISGLTTADPARCCVLELGPGDGLSLIGLACAYPESSFAGVDSSIRSIEAAEETRQECGITNVEFHHKDLLDIGPEFGAFDYIIANGLYSWVPGPVREHLLKICSQNLAPSGVACITYNVFPGCHLRRMVRDMLLLHTGSLQRRDEKIERARNFLDFLRSACSGEGALGGEIVETLHHADELLYHDDLSPVNEPVYFHQFVAHAGQYGLKYAGDTAWIDFQDRLLGPDHQEALAAFAADDPMRRIQYLDFIKNRRFRRSLACHASNSLDREPRPESFDGLNAALNEPLVAVSSNDGRTAEFKTAEGKSISTNHPYVSELLRKLTQTFPEPAELGGLDADSMDMVLKLCAAELIELRLARCTAATGPGARPVASPLVRAEICRGRTMVVNLRQRSVDLAGTPALAVLPRLDGTRSRENLREEFGEDVDELLDKLARLSLLQA